MSKIIHNKYFAFLMITTDPDLDQGDNEEIGKTSRGRLKGSAFELAEARLSKQIWGLYSRTRYRKRIVPGSRLLFYIGGHRENKSSIIASADVAKVEQWNLRKGTIDPAKFLTDFPSIVLRLSNVLFFPRPILLRDILHKLSIKPKNMKFWGVTLQGGCTGLTESDWKILSGN